MVKLPAIKKSITNFLLGEEGQISKKALFGIGLAISGLATKIAKADHYSSTDVGYTPATKLITGTHTSSHVSY